MSMQIMCDGRRGRRHGPARLPWVPGPTQRLNVHGEVVEHSADDGEYGDGEADVIQRFHPSVSARCRFDCSNPACDQNVVVTEGHMREIWEWLTRAGESAVTLEELQTLLRGPWEKLRLTECRDTMRALRSILGT